MQREIQRRAYEHQRAVEAGERVVVGVNAFELEQEVPVDIATIDPALEQAQVERVRALRGRRDQAETDRTLRSLGDAARATDNLVPAILAAVKACATVGEIADVLRAVFGEHTPSYTM